MELINRLVERGAAVRKPSLQDRRQVLVELTPLGEELLEKLNAEHQKELQTCAPELMAQMSLILASAADAEDNTAVANTSDSSMLEPEKLEAASA